MPSNELIGQFMKRITINTLVDIGCLITFIPSLISGFVLYLVLPSGGGRGNSWSVYLGLVSAVASG